jgi:hypothetical protein
MRGVEGRGREREFQFIPSAESTGTGEVEGGGDGVSSVYHQQNQMVGKEGVIGCREGPNQTNVDTGLRQRVIGSREGPNQTNVDAGVRQRVIGGANQTYGFCACSIKMFVISLTWVRGGM